MKNGLQMLCHFCKYHSQPLGLYVCYSFSLKGLPPPGSLLMFSLIILNLAPQSSLHTLLKPHCCCLPPHTLRIKPRQNTRFHLQKHDQMGHVPEYTEPVPSTGQPLSQQLPGTLQFGLISSLSNSMMNKFLPSQFTLHCSSENETIKDLLNTE